MNRRSLLRRAGLATSGWLVGESAFRGGVFGVAHAADCSARPPGVQLYTVRDLLQRDARTALVSLASRGLEELELYGLDDPNSAEPFGMTARELKRAVEDNGLSLPSSHIGGALADTAMISDRAEALGIRALFVALAPEFTGATEDGGSQMVAAQSLEQLDRLAERLNRAGREFQARGLTFGYHNHHVEFLPVAGEVAFDYLMARTDPEVVKIELDVGWVALAGVDVVDCLSRYAGRVFACHLKDFVPARGRARNQPPQTQLVEPGAGSVDFEAVLNKMDEIGVAHGFLEIDVAEDPLAAVERGHRHLQTFCA